MADCLGSVGLPSMKARQKKLCQEMQKPRAAAVYKDANNVGARMLAKLGWSEGKGLGRNEDGMVDPLLTRFKKDNEGLGYAGENDDQWTQHDAGFNELLKRLNGSGTEEDAATAAELETIDPKAQLQSLEERSKKSRARVHYRKFTRGKDLSQVNEKDLANIFGKRSLADLNKPTGSEQQASNGVSAAASDNDSETEVQTNILGLTTIKASQSLQEYFQEKMKMRKAALAQGNQGSVETPNSTDSAQHENSEMAVETKKKKKSKKRQDSSEEMPEEQQVAEEPVQEQSATDTKVKKSKRKHETISEIENSHVVEEAATELDASEPIKKKKIKKRKNDSNQEESGQTEELGNGSENSSDILDTAPSKKKKKSKKDTPEEMETVSVEQPDAETTTENVSLEVEPAKKKKKTKKTKLGTEAELESEAVADAGDTMGNESHGKDETTEGPANIEESNNDAALGAEMTCPVKVAILKHLDEMAFPGSNFGNIIGYRLTENVKLVRRDDNMRRKLEKHRYATQKNVSDHRKWQKLKKVTAFEAI
ncbi:PIN2/TERF1-interacting telomerase inhibitor 1 isoform X1 [Anopheles darlingi]|uniref:PIN2/TERF1-interacting telomerase inhibitor 1 isoform X1 n=1 Tax=Anopheles darlingi TaxID=43151 RepID=UPI0021002F63|nr:PIN2/TERF1-interacting telomerase inhibitor 1 isoform X1 [Anopheles darlingi]